MVELNKNNKLAGVERLAIEDQNHKPFIETFGDKQEDLSSKAKYFLWLSRLFVFFSIIAVGVTVASSLSLMQLASMIEVRPFLVSNQNSTDEIVRVEPMSSKMASKEHMMIMFIKQYVRTRNTIISDKKEMMIRWFHGGMIDFLSSKYVFIQFDLYRKRIWEKAMGAGMTREVEITSIKKQGGKKSKLWKVDFITYDINPLTINPDTGVIVPRKRYWTASIEAKFLKNRVFMSRRLLNPLGFTVQRYSQVSVDQYR